MPEFGAPEEALPEDIVQNGLDWARDEYVNERRQDAVELLKHYYGYGLVIYEQHIQELQTVIAAADGVKSIDERDDWSGAGYNQINLNDGSILSTSRLFIPEPITSELPPSTLLDKEIKQRYVLQLSYGGNGVGLDGAKAAKAFDITLPMGAQQEIIDGKYTPSCVCITEAVITEYDEDNRVVSARMSQLSAVTWEAKLRPEFAPDPAQDPEGYAAWESQEPITKLDASFGVSDVIRDKYWWGKEAIGFKHVVAKDVLSHRRSVPLTPEGLEHLIRYGFLLDRFFQSKFGSSMPVPYKSEAESDSKVLALGAPEAIVAT